MAFDDDPFDQAAAGRQARGEARREQAHAQSAYEAGRAAHAGNADVFDAGYDDAGTDALHEQGRRFAQADRGPRGFFGGPARPTATPRVVEEGSGLVLGLIVYALALNYLRGGPAQVRSWLRAKFFNRPDATFDPNPDAGPPNLAPLLPPATPQGPLAPLLPPDLAPLAPPPPGQSQGPLAPLLPPNLAPLLPAAPGQPQGPLVPRP